MIKASSGLGRKMQENDQGHLVADGTLSSFMGRWGHEMFHLVSRENVTFCHLMMLKLKYKDSANTL